jgi:hypothetical protein
MLKGCFLAYFWPVNLIGESTREKTRTEGEVLRDCEDALAPILDFWLLEVSFFGGADRVRRGSLVSALMGGTALGVER